MRITKETLARIIKEELESIVNEQTCGDETNMEEANTVSDTDNILFKIMDKVANRALQIMDTTDQELKDSSDLGQKLSELSNEVVTARLQDIDGMAKELVQRFQQK